MQLDVGSPYQTSVSSSGICFSAQTSWYSCDASAVPSAPSCHESEMRTATTWNVSWCWSTHSKANAGNAVGLSNRTPWTVPAAGWHVKGRGDKHVENAPNSPRRHGDTEEKR